MKHQHKYYLLDFKYNSEAGRVMREWNSGQTLEDAQIRLQHWWGISPAAVEIIWKQLEDQYGCKSVPLRAPGTKCNHVRTEYTDWKGWTGPAVVLKALIRNERLPS